MKTNTLFFHALTPVHSGTGQASASVVDLPVAREKVTGWPILPASSLKGVLRNGRRTEEADRFFGSLDAAGSVTLTDARLLCFPARSYAGTLAYVTGPRALGRFFRDARALNAAPLVSTASFPGALSTHAARVAPGSALTYAGRIYLEDLDLTAQEDAALAALAGALANVLFADAEDERAAFVRRFVLVSDTVFDFLAETATEVIARVRLQEETKTVMPGGLWYEEAVPAEAIFAGFLLQPDGSDYVPPPVLQVGGQASVGRGLLGVRVR